MYKLVGNIHDSEDKDLRYDSLGLSCARHNEGDQLKLMVLSLPLHPRIGLGCCHKEISPRARNSKIFCRLESRLATFQKHYAGNLHYECHIKTTVFQFKIIQWNIDWFKKNVVFYQITVCAMLVLNQDWWLVISEFCINTCSMKNIWFWFFLFAKGENFESMKDKKMQIQIHF